MNLPSRSEIQWRLKTMFPTSAAGDGRRSVLGASAEILKSATLALYLCVAMAQAQTMLLRDDFNNVDPWSSGALAQISSSNQHFIISGRFPPLNPEQPLDTHAAGYRAMGPISSGPLPNYQTLELRADLAKANQNEALASIHFLWRPEDQGYMVLKDQDEIALVKFYNGAKSLAFFFHEIVPIKNENVTLVLSLTRLGSVVRINTRVLDKNNAYAVLFDRTVTDTPQADPMLPSRAFKGIRSEPDAPGSPWPVMVLPSHVELGVTWANPDRAPQPDAEAVFGDLEVWRYESPQLSIQSAVVLSWPVTQGKFVLESAPAVDGPWAAISNPWWRTNAGQMQVCLLASESQKLVRLQQALFPANTSFDRSQGEIPEGVAVDPFGNVYVSLGGPSGPRHGEIWKFTPSGDKSVLVDFGTPGVIGLTADAAGNIYVARAVAPNNGVFRVDREGKTVRLPGTEQMVMPNSMVFDPEGNLFITETFSFDPPLTPYPATNGIAPAFGRGGIWRIPPQGNAELWLRDELLSGTGILAGMLQFPAGANGIGFYQGALYVANTERGLILRIPVRSDGGPGVPAIVAQVPDPDPSFLPLFGPPVPDGLALDNLGNLYVTVINRHAVIRISSDGLTWKSIASMADRLDAPASIAFGTTPSERTSLFVTSMSMVPGFAGPSLVKIHVGVPGMP